LVEGDQEHGKEETAVAREDQGIIEVEIDN